MSSVIEIKHSFRFDRSVDHCREVVRRRSPASQPPVIGEALRTLRRGGSLPELEAAVEAYVIEIGEDACSPALQDLREEIFEHGRMCDCPTERYREFTWEVDEALAVLGTRAWVMEGSEDLVYAGLRDVRLRIDELHDLDHMQMIEVRLSSTAEAVTVEVNGEALTLRPVPSGRSELYTNAFVLGHSDPLQQVLALPPEHLRLAQIYLWSVRAGNGFIGRLEDTRPLQVLHGLEPLTEAELEVATALARGWGGTLAELHGLARASLAA